MVEDGRGQPAGAAADVEDAAVAGLQLVQDHAVGRLEKERLQQVAVVAMTPAVKLAPRVGGRVRHAFFPNLPGRGGPLSYRTRNVRLFRQSKRNAAGATVAIPCVPPGERAAAART